MAILSKKQRQQYFKYLGLGEYNKDNIKKVQEKYFVRREDIDGEYGQNTDKLIVNLYRVNKYAPHFKITEFKCHCNGKYCTGYPAYLDIDELKNLEAVRKKFGATNISSGLRCKRWNAEQSGSVTNSKHTQGKAVDIYGAFTKTNAQRETVKKYWYTLHDANYCYHGTKNMGTSVHCDSK